jgi:Zn-dependent protease with chaperone function
MIGVSHSGPSAPGVALRALVLLLLWAGFYVLGVGLAVALLWVPWAQINYGSGPDLGGALAAAGALWLLWGLRPRFRRQANREPPLPTGRHPKLHALVADVARRAGHPVPHELHLLPEANAYAGQRSELWRRGKSLVGIGLPYLAWLDRAGVEAIIAHELGHHLSGDVRLGPWVHRTRNLMGHTLDHLEGSGFWLDLPFVGYARAFLRYSMSVSRAQEVAADAVSARVAGSAAAARALVVSEARSAIWHVYLKTEIEPMLEAGFLPQLLEGFRHFEAAIREHRERQQSTPKPAEKSSQYDTHPTLEERLSALGVTEAPLSGEAGALELLDEASEAEEYVLRSMLIDGTRPLKPLTWDAAGRELWLPRFVERIQPYQTALAKVTPETMPAVLAQIDDWAERLRSGLALFSPEAKRRHVLAMFGTWYAVYLVNLGFELEALPGCPVRTKRGPIAVEPFAEIATLSDGKLAHEEWLSRCAEIRAAVA